VLLPLLPPQWASDFTMCLIDGPDDDTVHPVRAHSVIIAQPTNKRCRGSRLGAACRIDVARLSRAAFSASASSRFRFLFHVFAIYRCYPLGIFRTVVRSETIQRFHVLTLPDQFVFNQFHLYAEVRIFSFTVQFPFFHFLFQISI
jgi:hypothetical protein